ncbi:DinB family protein [Phaeacidiphilus oryzae]|uniref:DinB family protein n=1 Tax=Phaeacidiphilus oryzae TaxID=348818 RepID=UPI0009FF1B39|nr:DinB family protein [Phaeacidiphilus oryzae]
MTIRDPKADLHRYLHTIRDSLVWKLDGLSEYDVRRPMTPTGTNLLGLVKHLAHVEAGYFGDCFERPFSEALPAHAPGAEPNADMWATAEESREDVLGLYQRVREHADATIDALPLDAPGRVPWWGERGDVTLQLILLHVIAETNRHAGHADILRELLDGAAGLTPRRSNLPDADETWWPTYQAHLEKTAREAGGV